MSSGPSQRYALLLIDISGSMLDSSGTGSISGSDSSKYEAAKTAAQRFLEGFQTGQDHVAVVPFESHQVREQVKAAVFAEEAETVQRQIAELPAPRPNYNTGLYSAVDAALDVLTEIKRQKPAAGILLVVLTDGQNQVLRGDDSDLLAGDDGLEKVTGKANEAGLQTITIGFGDETVPLGKKGAVDAAALRRLAWPAASHFHTAQDVQSLGKLFGVARQLLVNRWQLTFTTDREDRGQLAGQDLRFQFRLRLEDRVLQSSWAAFKTPQMAAPPFEGKLDAAERQALARVSVSAPQPRSPLPGGTVAIRRVLIFTAFAGLLAFLWFAMPVWLWPNKTAGLPSRTEFRAAQPKASTAPAREKPAPAVPPGPAATLILDQLPAQDQPGQTQIQFAPLPPQSSPDKTLFDPRGQQTLLLKPDETVIDPRGQETLIRPPEEKPPFSTKKS
ncbi:MAG: VWA domain-containing protein [Acidobacteria bacterium]|nr:VWA domain-containing protein [Acidobacteriota bacterium]